MTQTSNRFFDEIAKLVTDAAGMAQGVAKEVETAVKTRAESFVADMDLVRREDFEVVRELAVAAREENERLTARIAALEERLVRLEGGKSGLAETLIAGDASGPAVG